MFISVLPAFCADRFNASKLHQIAHERKADSTIAVVEPQSAALTLLPQPTSAVTPF
jgi:hypothetical protein